MTDFKPLREQPFGYLCDWGNDSFGLTRQTVYYGEPGSATEDDWNEYPKVHNNTPIYTVDQVNALLARLDAAEAALNDAATSLETISRLAGKEAYPDGTITCMGSFSEVRGYAISRATTARAALTKGHEALSDSFSGDDASLIASIEALIALDTEGALRPHGLGGHARSLLSSAAVRLTALRAQVGRVPDGWQLVPQLPTMDMCQRMRDQNMAGAMDNHNAYIAALSSAPTAPQAGTTSEGGGS